MRNMCQCNECNSIIKCNQPEGTHSYFDRCEQHRGMQVLEKITLKTELDMEKAFGTDGQNAEDKQR